MSDAEQLGFDLDARLGKGHDMLDEARPHLVRVLPGDRANGQLEAGLGRDDSARATAADAADIERGLRRRALGEDAQIVAEKGLDAGRALNLRTDCLPKLIHVARLPISHGNRVVVETGNEHAAALVVQGGDDARQVMRRIRYRAAVAPGMQIMRRTLNPHFSRDAAAHCVTDNRLLGGEGAVGDDQRIGRKQFLVRRDTGAGVFRSELLFAFEEELQVDWQPTASAQNRVDRHEVEPNAAFVIDRSARHQPAVDESRLKGRRPPQRFIADRLDVIVRVKEQGRLVGAGMQPVSVQDRIAGCWQSLHIDQPDSAHLRQDPVGAGQQLRLEFAVLADRWEAQQRLESVQRAFPRSPALFNCRLDVVFPHFVTLEHPSILALAAPPRELLTIRPQLLDSLV